MPGIYLEKPIRLLIPPEVAGYVGLTVELGFTQSLLAWIFFVNLWAAVFNALPCWPPTDTTSWHPYYSGLPGEARSSPSSYSPRPSSSQSPQRS